MGWGGWGTGPSSPEMEFGIHLEEALVRTAAAFGRPVQGPAWLDCSFPGADEQPAVYFAQSGKRACHELLNGTSKRFTSNPK